MFPSCAVCDCAHFSSVFWFHLRWPRNAERGRRIHEASPIRCIRRQISELWAHHGRWRHWAVSMWSYHKRQYEVQPHVTVRRLRSQLRTHQRMNSRRCNSDSARSPHNQWSGHPRSHNPRYQPQVMVTEALAQYQQIGECHMAHIIEAAQLTHPTSSTDEVDMQPNPSTPRPDTHDIATPRRRIGGRCRTCAVSTQADSKRKCAACTMCSRRKANHDCNSGPTETQHVTTCTPSA